MRYKNAPGITPRIGDEVECGLPGNTAIVSSLGKKNTMITNCAVDGKLHLNDPEQAVLVKDVDGYFHAPYLIA